MRTELPVVGVPYVCARGGELKEWAQNEVCVGEEDIGEHLEGSSVRTGFAEEES